MILGPILGHGSEIGRHGGAESGQSRCPPSLEGQPHQNVGVGGNRQPADGGSSRTTRTATVGAS